MVHRATRDGSGQDVSSKDDWTKRSGGGAEPEIAIKQQTTGTRRQLCSDINLELDEVLIADVLSTCLLREHGSQ
ncbi:hypothetical protein ASE12_14245 [Aeromicrobium sp. Root236]|nr:hypothetical protein ASE12_14245 [Aeromicrobium sp. Root236]